MYLQLHVSEPCSGLQGALKGLDGLMMPLRLWPVRIDTPIMVLIVMDQCNRRLSVTSLRQARNPAFPAPPSPEDEATDCGPHPARQAALMGSTVASVRPTVSRAALEGSSADQLEPVTKRRAVQQQQQQQQQQQHDEGYSLQPCLTAAEIAESVPQDMGAMLSDAGLPPGLDDFQVQPAQPSYAELARSVSLQYAPRACDDGSEPDAHARRLGGLGNSASWRHVSAADAATTSRGVELQSFRPVSCLYDPEMYAAAGLTDQRSFLPRSVLAAQEDAVVPRLPPQALQQSYASAPHNALSGAQLTLDLRPPLKKCYVEIEELLSSEAKLGDQKPLVPRAEMGQVSDRSHRSLAPALNDPSFAPLLDELLSWHS